MGKQFTEDYQPTKRGSGKKRLMLEAIRAELGDKDGEKEFLRKVVKIGLGGENVGDPNPALLNMVLNRIEPPLKATSPYIDFDFNPDSKPHEQASQVMYGVSNGIIPPDVGALFIASIKSMVDIEENTDLKERIEKLEALLNGD